MYKSKIEIIRNHDYKINYSCIKFSKIKVKIDKHQSNIYKYLNNKFNPQNVYQKLFVLYY